MLWDEAGLLYAGEDDLVAELLPVEPALLTDDGLDDVLLLTDDDLDDVLLDMDALLPVLLLVPMPFLTEVPLLTEETLLRLPVALLAEDLMRVPSVCARRP